MIDYSDFPLAKGEPRALAKHRRRVEDEAALKAAYGEVDARDGGVCWVTGRHTVAGVPDPRYRREHHHLRGRKVAPERVADPMNIITCTAESHSLIESGHIQVEGIDTNKPVRFHWREGNYLRPFVIKSRRWSQQGE